MRKRFTFKSKCHTITQNTYRKYLTPPLDDIIHSMLQTFRITLVVFATLLIGTGAYLVIGGGLALAQSGVKAECLVNANCVGFPNGVCGSDNKCQ